ncbi:hypothetical protein [Ralstonia soli]|uniref:Uncharacterized protein n=1 Tax=Ralstonia soli TaxID=2953896 RepID=A0ABT1AHC6_9RALS|nr:hypothetical protein [Ralstonia soli]MCO5397800.1 hypothetical protein [Ralstonia soli]
MNANRTSLGALIEKWLGAGASTPKRIIRLRDSGRHNVCVEVKVARMAGEASLFFFRHEDGSWQVFPPSQVACR